MESVGTTSGIENRIVTINSEYCLLILRRKTSPLALRLGANLGGHGVEDRRAVGSKCH